MLAQREMKPTGTVSARVNRARRASWLWRMRNVLRPTYLKAAIAVKWVAPLATKFGLLVGYAELRARVWHAGEWVDYGVLSRRVVTDAGVAYIVDDWDGGANTIDDFNYHGVGTGVGAEAAGDTALGTESTTVLNPDSTRATGTKTQPAANEMRSVGTVTFDGSAAITEHGIFTQAATGGGTLLDRSVFSAINVGSGDSIQFTYTLTLASGG
jgi:hypothetical protein